MMKLQSLVRCYFTLTFLLMSLVTFASESTFRFSHFNHDSHVIPNQINAIVQDKGGYLWLASTHGLFKFDGLMSEYFATEDEDGKNLNGAVLSDLVIDANGILWIANHSELNSVDTLTGDVGRHVVPKELSGTQSAPVISRLALDENNQLWLATDNGLMQFLPESERFVSLASGSDINVESNLPVVGLSYSQGYIWFTQPGKGLMRLQVDTKQLLEIPFPNQIFATDTMQNSSSLLAGKSGSVYIGFMGGTVLRYRTDEQSFEKIDYAPQVSFSESDKVAHILEDQDGDVWISTHQHGLFSIIDDNVTQILPNDSDPESLPSERVNKTFADNQHNLWVMNSGQGLSILRQNYKNVGAINKFTRGWQRIEDNIAWGIDEDQDGRLWIGTNQNGLYVIDSAKKLNKQFVHDPSSSNSLSNNRVLDVFATSDNEIWVSTGSGLNQFRPESNDFVRYFNEPGSNFIDKMFSKIFEDKDKQLWVATLGAGAVRLDENRNASFFRATDTGQSIASNYVTSFTQDNSGRIWIGTRNGISIYNEAKNTFEHILADSEIWSLNIDNIRNKVLVGTSDGVAIVSPGNGETQWLTQKQQNLAGGRVYCVFGDDNHYYFSTDIGLTQMSHAGKINHFYWYDGLQNGYNLNGCHKSKSGHLYFSGNKGVSYFHPDRLTQETFSPKANITALRTYDNDKGGYHKEVATNGFVSLKHDDNNLRLNFNGIYFKYIDGLKLRYRLVGLNDTWTVELPRDSIIPTGNGFATYTNLSPGEYNFEVQYEVEGAMPSNVAQLTFTIKPPWWNTLWAWIFYAIAVIVSIYSYIQWRLTHLKQEKANLTRLVEERTQSLKKMADKALHLSDQKKNLFASVSHELRTPLTLIMSPVETLLKQVTDTEQEVKLKNIRRHTLRLENMVNQMLELSLLDAEPHFDKRTYQVDRVIEELTFSFREVAEHHGMTIEITSRSHANLHVVEDSLHKILLNLLSNAIKYGLPNTVIRVGSACEDNQLVCWVDDEGPGFNHEQAQMIRKRFYRLGSTASDTPGSGLGLSIVSELLEANQGDLAVKSTPGKGSSFVFTFPSSCLVEDVSEASPWDHQMTENYLEELRFVQPSESTKQSTQSDKPPILIVEDNAEIGAFITELLASDYQCYLASDGNQGLTLARDKQPELIISDVMMPELDGFTMTQTLKQDEVTCHIPILLLSAKSDIESRIQGLQHQADDYMGKPFNSDELKLKVTNLINTRSRLRASLASTIGVTKAKENSEFANIHSKDQKFLEKFEQLIESHFTDEDLNRKYVADKLAVSERQLNRKLSAIIDYNFTQYLRKFRLRKSLNLANKGLQISEISEKVGFASSTYFSSCFKNEFQMTFKEYEQQQKK